MAEFFSIPVQTVAQGQNVLFTDTVNNCKKSCWIMHREDSGIVTLRAPQNQCAKYLVDFSGNIAVATGGTVGAIAVAIAIDGEALQSTNMVVTPTVEGAFFNVSSQAYITVPCGCCVTISIENTSVATAISVGNANLTVNRTA